MPPAPLPSTIISKKHAVFMNKVLTVYEHSVNNYVNKL